MANVVVSAIATFNGKSLAKGKKQISDFDKSAQKLGRTLTKYLGATALVAFGKSSVNAFIESEKAAAKLRTTVSNLGLSFEQSGIEAYLQKLSLQFGIVDESLIPGFQRLLIVTKNVAQAQSIFQTALDVSAGTGKDLTSVSTSLSKAYLGDNVALGRLGVGLSKAQLKSASFLEVQKTLNANFGGQASAAVQGYAGDMAKLTVAVDESKEAIGKGLLDAMKTLSGDTSIDTFTKNMIKSANVIAGAFNSIARFISTLIPGNVIKVNGEWKLKSELGSTQSFQSLSAINLANKTTKARKDELAIITASNKARSEIDKLKDKFDLERIGLNAALNAATDDETKLRIKSQIAILDNNEALAKKYNAELEAAKAANDLASAFKLGGLTWLSSVQDIKNYVAAMTSAATGYASSQLGKGGTAYTGPSYPNEITGAMVTKYINEEMARISDVSIPTLLEKLRTTVKSGYDIPSASSFYGALPDTRSTQIAQNMAASPTINVNVEGSVLALSEMDNAIQDALLRIYKQNGDLAPAGFIP